MPWNPRPERLVRELNDISASFRSPIGASGTPRRALIDKALLLRHVGPFQLQAAISALHARAARAADT